MKQSEFQQFVIEQQLKFIEFVTQQFAEQKKLMNHFQIIWIRLNINYKIKIIS